MHGQPRDRRRAPRAPTRNLLGYARRIDEQRFCVLGIASTIDLSISGIRFLAYELIPVGSALELELVLDGRPAKITEARVVRILSRRDGAAEVACELVSADPAARRTIFGFVEDYHRERLAG